MQKYFYNIFTEFIFFIDLLHVKYYEKKWKQIILSKRAKAHRLRKYHQKISLTSFCKEAGLQTRPRIIYCITGSVIG